uniref:RIC3 domain-containing protein n=1 Tax=Parastrongyloides trichosuri TaxID=131310 RepID=A0A0N5A0I6_PARTI
MNYSEKISRDHIKHSNKSSRYKHHNKMKKINNLSFEDDEEEIMPRWKMFMVVGIVVLCFAILYPNLLSPLFNSFFSSSRNQKQSNTPPISPVHPALNNARAGGPRTGGPNIHSAYRMAAQNQQAEASVTRGGMFGWLLPFYTIGVMIFLAYTLYKMMSNKKDKKSRRGRHRNIYDSDYDECSDTDEDDDIDNMNSKKMRRLQGQLKETEIAMTKILMQLENMQGMEALMRQATGASKNEDNNDKINEEQTDLQERLNNNTDEIRKTLDQFHSLNKYYSDLKELAQHNNLKGMENDESSSSDESDISNESNDENIENLNENTREINENTKNNTCSNNDNNDEINIVEGEIVNANHENDENNIIIDNAYTKDNKELENNKVIEDKRKECDENKNENIIDTLNSSPDQYEDNQNTSTVTKTLKKGRKKYSRREK